MNAPIPQSVCPEIASMPAPAGCLAPAAAPALQDSIRNPKSEIRNLLEACLRMLKLTGGSQYWTGDIRAA